MSYLAALAVTLVIEVPVYVLGLRGLRVWQAVVVNVVSHPVAWFVLWPVLRGVLGDGAAFVGVELAVCAGEWWALGRWCADRGRLAAVVLLSNAASLATGALLLLL